MTLCCLCGSPTNEDFGAPIFLFMEKKICFTCRYDLIPALYKQSGNGDGGFIHLIFRDCLQSSHNRKRRKQITRYKDVLRTLLHKYKFSCVRCSSSEKLTIDHIVPVKHGGSDELSNLQILCRSCNSRKWASI